MALSITLKLAILPIMFLRGTTTYSISCTVEIEVR